MIKSTYSKEFNCDIDKIWQIVTDNNNYNWRSDITSLEVKDDLHFIEYNKNFPTYFTITKKQEFEEYCFELSNSNLKGKWTGIFKRLEDNKVLFECTEELEVKKKFLQLFACFYIKNQQKKYFSDLEKEVQRIK